MYTECVCVFLCIPLRWILYQVLQAYWSLSVSWTYTAPSFVRQPNWPVQSTTLSERRPEQRFPRAAAAPCSCRVASANRHALVARPYYFSHVKIKRATRAITPGPAGGCTHLQALNSPRCAYRTSRNTKILNHWRLWTHKHIGVLLFAIFHTSNRFLKIKSIRYCEFEV